MDERFKNIIGKTLDLFKKYGIRSVSMDDIARELSISKKTIYQYVSNKEDLIAEVLEYENDTLKVLIDNLENDEVNAIDALLEVSLFFSKEIRETNPVWSFDLNKYYPELYRKHVNEKREFGYNKIYNNLLIGKKQGLFREELNPELVARLYVQKIEDVMDPEFLDSAKFSFETVFKVMFENHIRGISNPTGIEYYEKQVKKMNIKL
jgi:AcrR family transcriptional regulator